MRADHVKYKDIYHVQKELESNLKSQLNQVKKQLSDQKSKEHQLKS